MAAWVGMVLAYGGRAPKDPGGPNRETKKPKVNDDEYDADGLVLLHKSVEVKRERFGTELARGHRRIGVAAT